MLRLTPATALGASTEREKMLFGFFNVVANVVKPFAHTMFYTNIARDYADHVRGKKNFGEPRGTTRSPENMENDM